jgi:phosphate-selective porin OprO/OprP
MKFTSGNILASTAMAALLIGTPAVAQDDDLAARITELEQQLQLLKRQLEAQVEQVQETAAQANEKAASSDVKIKMKGPTPTIESTDGRYSMRFTGRIHYDTALIDQTPANSSIGDARIQPDLNSGTNFRRARIGVDGKIAGDWRYNLTADFGGTIDNNGFLYEAYLAYVGFKPLTLTLGRHKAATGYNERVSSNDISFIERSLGHNVMSAPFSPPANGFSGKANGDHWSVDTGFFYGDRTAGVVNLDESFYWSGRVATAPINEKEEMVHFGLHANYLFEPEQILGARRTRFADRPEIRTDPTRWISARSQSALNNDEAWAYGLEVAGKYQNFWANGEYNLMGMNQNLIGAPGTGVPDGDFMSWYLQGGWIITGETKRYRMSKAAWSGVKPGQEFDLNAGGWGALELALRYSYADLNDNENLFVTDATGASQFVGFRGGQEQNWTVGVNWYVNENIRFMFNWINADIDRLSDGDAPGEGGLQIGDNFNIYALRAQVKW